MDFDAKPATPKRRCKFELSQGWRLQLPVKSHIEQSLNLAIAICMFKMKMESETQRSRRLQPRIKMIYRD